MKPIRIFSPTLSLLGEIDGYRSLSLYRRYYEPGEVRLEINLNKQNTEHLQRGNILLPGTDFHKAGIIRHREISLGEEGRGSENISVRGPLLGGLLSRRITLPPALSSHDTITNDAETVMKYFVDENIVDATDTDRNISILSIATDQDRGASLFWRTRYENLVEVIEEISRVSGLGWHIYMDLSIPGLVFDVYEGEDRSKINIDGNPPVIFSPDYDSIRMLSFVDSDLSLRNVAYAGGQGEEELRDIEEIGTDTGLDRMEIFLDIRDAANTTELATRGAQELAEMQNEIYLNGEILEMSPFLYEEDYDLGDIVTLQNAHWGVVDHPRITEIREEHRDSGFRIGAVFGEQRPTLVDLVKKDFSQVDREVRR